jgi:hypothetical protein
VSDALLAILRLLLLVLVYLFFLRVVRAVWVEVRSPAPAKVPVPAGAAAAPAKAPKPAKPPRATRKERVPSALVATEPPELAGASFAITGPEVVIGRDAACGITLDTFVSGRHARVTVLDGEVRLEDLGSTNGTFVNRRRVTSPVIVRTGDRVQVGNAMLEVR